MTLKIESGYSNEYLSYRVVTPDGEVVADFATEKAAKTYINSSDSRVEISEEDMPF